MTAAKFKRFMFSVWGYALSNIAYIFILMILNDSWLSSVWLYYVILNIRNVESLMHIADRYARREIANGAESLLLQALQFQLLAY
jgi:hypothetical protein